MDKKIEELVERIVKKDNKNANMCLRDILVQKVKRRILGQIDQE